MKNNFAFFTAGEFAKLNHINKRTLHYYDSVGVFSPKYKGDNGYRYYTYEQSIDLENILALREIGMSIEEIQRYMKKPNREDFQKIAKSKICEINQTIARLKQLKNILIEKSKMIDLCDEIYDGKIEIVTLKEEYLLMTNLHLTFETTSSFFYNSNAIMEHLKASWKFSNYKKSCGSYISLEKIKNKKFEEYDGVFTRIDKNKSNLKIKPGGKYLRGFSIGDWNKIPILYEKMLRFANDNNVTLTGYAFESGLNEFAISGEDEYVTQIEILCNTCL